MPAWKFRLYVSQTGREDLQQCINELDVAIVESFKVRIRYLANTPIHDWKHPHFKKLSGVKDIYEIRFQQNNSQFRPMGFFGPGEHEFTILIWATHKQDIYEPSNAIKSAERRRDQINQGSASSMPLKINGEEFPFP